MQICGRNTRTPPTPPMTPSTSRLFTRPSGSQPPSRLPAPAKPASIQSIGYCATQKISANTANTTARSAVDADDRMGQEAIDPVGAPAVALGPTGRAAHPDLLGPVVARLEGAPGAILGGRHALEGARQPGLRHGALQLPCELGQAAAGARHDRHDRAAELAPEALRVDVDRRPLGEVDHVQGDDGRQPQLQHLAREVEIALEVGRVEQQQDHVGPRLAGHLPQEGVARHALVGGGPDML